MASGEGKPASPGPSAETEAESEAKPQEEEAKGGADDKDAAPPARDKSPERDKDRSAAQPTSGPAARPLSLFSAPLPLE
jgi:hypothetical protein